MAWNEQKHPRDDEGKFTFKNGSVSNKSKNEDNFTSEPLRGRVNFDEIKEALYGATSKTAEDNFKTKERNNLIKKLYNKLDPGQILFSSLEKLKEIDKEYSQHNFEEKNVDDKFKYDFKKHDELKGLLLSHHDTKNNTPLPEGYELLQKYHSSKTGLDVEFFEHGKELILSFPGSEQPKEDYLVSDARAFVGHSFSQLDEAQDILDNIKKNPRFKNHKIIVTGYSLGGNIAGGLSALNNIEGITFNSFGDLSGIIQQKANNSGKEIEIYPEKLINYRHEKDSISNFKHLGLNYKLPKPEGIHLTPFSKHDIKNLNHSINRLRQGTIYHNQTKYYPKSRYSK